MAIGKHACISDMNCSRVQAVVYVVVAFH